MTWIETDLPEIEMLKTQDVMVINPHVGAILLDAAERQRKAGNPKPTKKLHVHYTAGRHARNCLYLTTCDWVRAAVAHGETNDCDQDCIVRAQEFEYAMPHNMFVEIAQPGTDESRYFRPAPPVVFLYDLCNGMMYTSGGIAGERAESGGSAFSVVEFNIDYESAKDRVQYYKRSDNVAHARGTSDVITRWHWSPHKIGTAITSEFVNLDASSLARLQVDHVCPEHTFTSIFREIENGPVLVSLTACPDGFFSRCIEDDPKGGKLNAKPNSKLLQRIALGTAKPAKSGRELAFVLQHQSPNDWHWRRAQSPRVAKHRRQDSQSGSDSD